jgi:NAD-dependent deacetylase
LVKNSALVLDFIIKDRQLKKLNPSGAHQMLAELEAHFDVHIYTKNVDDLHERAGSRNVLHA